MPGFELIGEEEKQAVLDVFDKGGVLYRYGLEARRRNIFRVDLFEKKIAEKVGAKHALFVSSGTAALKLALIGVGVKPGDEVITQSFTFIATVEAILELGAVPVITEVDKSLNMDSGDLKKKISSKTRCIVPVAMAGVPPRMDEIRAIAETYGIPIVEDSAQALGATYRGKAVGTIGVAGIYSLDIGKIITSGEGGVLVTNDSNIFLRAREYSDHGHQQNPNFPRGEDTRVMWGFNYKITELQGAIALAQLGKMDDILARQRSNKMRIKIAIKDIPGLEFRDIPDEQGDAGDSLIFFLESKERALLFAHKLKESGFGTKNLPDAISWHFAGTWTHIFNQPEYKDKNLEECWSQSNNYLRRAIALPIMVNMPEEQIDKIIKMIRMLTKEALPRNLKNYSYKI